MINNDGKPSPQELQKRMDDIPDVWLKCPICGHAIYKKHINEYRTCPECHYGFRLGAKARIDVTILNRSILKLKQLISLMIQNT